MKKTLLVHPCAESISDRRYDVLFGTIGSTATAVTISCCKSLEFSYLSLTISSFKFQIFGSDSVKYRRQTGRLRIESHPSDGLTKGVKWSYKEVKWSDRGQNGHARGWNGHTRGRKGLIWWWWWRVKTALLSRGGSKFIAKIRSFYQVHTGPADMIDTFSTRKKIKISTLALCCKLGLYNIAAQYSI